MGILTAIATCLEKFMVFQGRAQRSEFWWFFLFTILAGFLAAPLDALLNTQVISVGVGVAFLLPTLAAGARRMHDTGRTGFWLALPLASLPFFLFGTWAVALAWIFLLAFVVLLLCLPGQRGANRFGPDPAVRHDLGAF